jgi:CBS domain-containing protein
MRTTTKSFLALTAADLMTAPVMTLPADTPLHEAARLLSGSGIHGAPVVDADGHCLGVVSSSDFVTYISKGGEPGGHCESISFIAPWGEIINIEESAEDEIRCYMTTPPVTVARETPIGELARTMVDAHIHRVLVIDQDRACGIVSSTDILTGVARAARTASPSNRRSPRGHRRPSRRTPPTDRAEQVS